MLISKLGTAKERITELEDISRQKLPKLKNRKEKQCVFGVGEMKRISKNLGTITEKQNQWNKYKIEKYLF